MVGVSGLIEHFSYLAIFFTLALAGLGLPVPEEVVLLTAGVLAAHGTLDFWRALVCCWLGIVIGDSIIYRVGARLGLHALEHRWFRRLFTPRLTAWIDRHFKRHGIHTVMAARLVSGLRAPTFLVAGMTHLAYWKFLLADGATALVSAPVMVWLGFRFGSAVPRMLGQIRAAHHWLAIGLGALTAIVTVFVLVRRRVRERRGVYEHVTEDIEHDLLDPHEREQHEREQHEREQREREQRA